ncbi:T9SS type A sorting domain-containing protein [Aquimarina sp. RZ0]|uniref:T9SS type A sorting domain-containing protein n=1 Tax=Aquimarina sp. RZ0 TaxID=2607730 RepID=UPI0011F16BD8|nr:T9SS type A sorting domain-containing protein [Aquimarina sp. RZ0]KAA1244481.1 T9SS type A sorting domain-containing protein [Aquimarina sp. RZ0]
MKKTIIVLSIFLCSIFGLHAQISQGGKPLSWTETFSKSTKIPTIKLANIDIEKLHKEDAEEVSKDVPLRFAYAHEVNYNPNNSGTWSTTTNGDRIWMLNIESSGAKSLNFTFSDFYLPEGAKLFVYNENKTDVRGAFTNTNNKESRAFGIAPIQGDKVTIEYYQPASVKEKPALQIATVAHDYKGIFNIAKGFNDSGSCNNNVACSVGDDWRDQIKSVALITLANGTRFCTGALINNTENDGTPYFLTANHCTGSSTANWVFVFNYQSASCSNVDGSLSQSVSGSTLLKKGAATDYSLVQLSATPPDSYNVYYSGWDATGTQPTNTTGIHHPAGDIKKISFDYEAPSISGYGGSSNTHWRINDWNDGTTEPGSSGSPLYDQNKRIIGQLHGGSAACGNNGYDAYGRFDLSFPNLSQWLAPGSSLKKVDGYDPSGGGTPPSDCEDVTLTFNFDNYPEETSWAITDSSGNTVESGGTYGGQADGSTLAIDLCLEEGCYQLTISDSYGDGMCCGYGSGSYLLADDTSATLASGASFGASETTDFCIGTRSNENVTFVQSTSKITKDRHLENIILYPNPANTILYIQNYKIKKASDIKVAIIDITGRTIKTESYIGTSITSNTVSIDINELPKGSYFLNITENNTSVVKRFTVSE